MEAETTPYFRGKVNITKGQSMRRWGLVLAILCIAGLVFGVWNHWQKKKLLADQLRIREATFVAGPLRLDGTIDYVAAFNSKVSQGVTSENNAVALLATIGGPNWPNKKFPTQSKQIQKHLGISTPNMKDMLVTWFVYYPAPKEDYFKRRWDILYFVADTDVVVASAAEWPEVTAWLKINEGVLDRVVTASQRTRWYVPRCGETMPEWFHETDSSGGGYGFEISALSVRGMFRLDRVNFTDACTDLLTPFRLAQLMPQQQSVFGFLGSCNNIESGSRWLSMLAASERLTAPQARQLLQELRNFPPVPSIDEIIATAGRYDLLDRIQRASRGDLTGLTFEEDLTTEECPDLVTCNWQEVMRQINRRWDKQLGCLRLGDKAACEVALKAEKDDMAWAEISPEYPSPTYETTASGTQFSAACKQERAALRKRRLANLKQQTAESSEVYARRIADLMILHQDMDYSILMLLRDRAAVRGDIAQLTLALAIYHAEKNVYPEKLTELVPDYLPTIPPDRFTTAPLHYQREGAGYLLYSVGQDGKDDGGEVKFSRDIGYRAPIATVKREFPLPSQGN